MRPGLGGAAFKLRDLLRRQGVVKVVEFNAQLLKNRALFFN
jgi:hypothetical protein